MVGGLSNFGRVMGCDFSGGTTIAAVVVDPFCALILIAVHKINRSDRCLILIDSVA